MARGVLRGVCCQSGRGGRGNGGRHGLAWQELQIIGAGVLFGAALGVMDIDPLLLRCRFDRMARSAKALEKVTLKGSGADRPPRDNVVYVGCLRYSATAKARSAKGGA